MWRLADAAGYEPLLAGEAPANAPPSAPLPQSRHPQPAAPPHHHSHHHSHTAVRIHSDREQAVAQSLLAAAHEEAPTLFALLGTSTEGLSEEEAAARLERHGPNVIATAGATPWFR